MSRNRIIGVNGGLPWSLPEDRKNFKALTTGKVLVVGRKTYEEEQDERHIDHADWCIVVSSSAPETLGSEKVKVARSFPEALSLAKELCEDSDESSIDCWVAGGERIFEEALKHSSAQEVHLTVVQTEVDVANTPKSAEGELTFAQFPSKYRWDRWFQEASRVTNETTQPEKPDFTQFVYVRKKQPTR